MCRRLLRYIDHPTLIGRGEWEPDEWHLNFLNRFKLKIWVKLRSFARHHPNLLTKPFNFFFNLIFGIAFHHYRKCYYFAFLFQFFAITYMESNFAILGLFFVILGFIADKWTQPVRVRVQAKEMAKMVAIKSIEEWEDETVRGLRVIT